MKLKYLAILILFILNISATVIADTSHVHGLQDNIEKIETENHLQNHDHNTEKNPCADHVCCHAGHVHHLLLTTTTLSLSVHSALYHFPSYIYSLLDFHSDLIKPPTV